MEALHETRSSHNSVLALHRTERVRALRALERERRYADASATREQLALMRLQHRAGWQPMSRTVHPHTVHVPPVHC